MAFVESTVQCIICRGAGHYHGIGVFDTEKRQPHICQNCNGKGVLVKKIPINPPLTDAVQSPLSQEAPLKDAASATFHDKKTHKEKRRPSSTI